MKQLPREHSRPGHASERADSRSAPRPARDGARPAERRGGRERRRPEGSKPRPARDLANVEEVVRPAVEPDVPEASVEAGGRMWTVRVLGRSGRPSRGEAPLLLLGFWEAGSSDEHPTLEASVVGRMLSALSPAHLEAALEKASPPPSQDRTRSFFDMTGQGRRR